MYSQNVRRSGCIGLVIALGVILGILYFLGDQVSDSPGLSAFITPTSAISSADLPLAFPTPPLNMPLAQSVRLLIPRANVIAPVVRVHLGNGGTWDVSQLGHNAGHLEGTPWIGQSGNMVLAGHVEMSDGSPGIFANLDQLHQGDQLLILEDDSATQIVYSVNSVRRVEPNDLSVLYSSEVDQLTLITCGDYDLLSNSYLIRIVVTGIRQT